MSRRWSDSEFSMTPIYRVRSGPLKYTILILILCKRLKWTNLHATRKAGATEIRLGSVTNKCQVLNK